MKIKLSIAQRVTLIGLLPQEGSYEKLRAIDSISRKIDLTVEEIDNLSFVQTGNRFQWNPEKEKEAGPLEAEFGDIETLVIAGALKQASDSEKLSRVLIPLYETFCLTV